MVQSGGAFYKWQNVGQVFEGTFLALGQGSYQGRPTYHASFTDLTGKPVKVNTPVILRSLLEENAKAGDKCRVTFVGLKPGKNSQPAKDFSLEIDREAAAGAQDEAAVAYDALVAAKGDVVAKSIKAAAENVAKADPAKQAEIYRKAVAA
jgi:hypothetical protein